MILYTIVIFLVIFISIRYSKKLNISEENPWVLPIAFAIKVLVGLYFLYIYTEVYGKGTLSADAGAFMSESNVLNQVFYTNPVDYLRLLTGIGYNQELVISYLTETSHWDAGAQAIISDNRNIIRLHSLIHFISFGNTAIHVIIMNFIALIGVKQLYLALKDKTTLKSIYLFIILLLFPSLLFWTSSILKEPLMFLGFALIIRGFIGGLSDKKKIIFILTGSVLLFLFKPYVLISIIPVFVFLAIHKILPKHKIIGALGGTLLLFILSVLTFSKTKDQVVHLFSRKQYDFKNVGKGGIHANNDTSFYFFKPSQLSSLKIQGDSVELMEPIHAAILQHGAIAEPSPVYLEPTGEKWHIYFINTKSDGYIELTMINDSFGQMMLNIPEALINTLFRPFPFDPGSWLKYPVLIESILLYLFLVLAFIRRKKLSSNDKTIITSLVIFIITLSLFIGWVTPVIGAIVRYRIPVTLSILIIGLILLSTSKKKSHE